MKRFARLVGRSYLLGSTPNPNPSSIRGSSGCYLYSSLRAISSASIPLPLRNQWPFSRNPSNSWASSPWLRFGGQRRSLFIETQSTPNPLSLMFYPGQPVMEVGSADFPNARTAMTSPLAKSMFEIDGVSRVFFRSDFVTVTKSEEVSWDFLKPEIFAAIMDFYSSGKPLFLDSNVAAYMDTAIHEDDSEIVAMIKELLETQIRPAVQEDDGGDIEYRGFDLDSGIVKLRMQGACSGCPSSSSVTLKSGIENMPTHYVPEVKGVDQELDTDEGASSSRLIIGRWRGVAAVRRLHPQSIHACRRSSLARSPASLRQSHRRHDPLRQFPFFLGLPSCSSPTAGVSPEVDMEEPSEEFSLGGRVPGSRHGTGSATKAEDEGKHINCFLCATMTT
ncbi:hypothetical protein MUK42_16192 [Musa troglodytarum]|uniref:Scaffold protein Nfu/NifU N-terminal domain-containing protein n=1 Tax=Musa troglodytarum TaxID=320322 RepID=A0A9E7HRR3_9LILI|nr:hypothetical protein MUK42_16192 [Musa troglodytarum]